MATIARYKHEADARERAELEGITYEHAPSDTWPDYPWAVVRIGIFEEWAAAELEAKRAVPTAEES